jgi:hypothetical protein
MTNGNREKTTMKTTPEQAPQHPPNAPVLPFGKHAGVPLPSVPSSYLAWLLREAKLSTGLRSGVADELQRRGIAPPEPPPLQPVPTCCSREALVHWHQDRLGRKRVRAQCRTCSRSLGFLPTVAPFTAMADAAASPAPVLDVLTRLEELGVGLESDGRGVWFAGDGWRRVPPDLKALVHQCSHQLAQMRGDTRQEAARA